jgi:hypothetical protein
MKESISLVTPLASQESKAKVRSTKTCVRRIEEVLELEGAKCRGYFALFKISSEFLGAQTRVLHIPIDSTNSTTSAFLLMTEIPSYSLKDRLSNDVKIILSNVVFAILDRDLLRRHISSKFCTDPSPKNSSTSQHCSIASIVCRKKFSIRFNSLFFRLSFNASIGRNELIMKWWNRYMGAEHEFERQEIRKIFK